MSRALAPRSSALSGADGGILARVAASRTFPRPTLKARGVPNARSLSRRKSMAHRAVAAARVKLGAEDAGPFLILLVLT